MAFPVEKKWIERAELELGARFPELHRQSLMESNGDTVVQYGGEEWEFLPVRDDSNRRRTARSWSGVVHVTVELRKSRVWPAEYVVFATAGDGNYLLFRIDTTSGCMLEDVFVWDHEHQIALPAGISLEGLLRSL